jgi:hypothetical protein
MECGQYPVSITTLPSYGIHLVTVARCQDLLTLAAESMVSLFALAYGFALVKRSE